jgi:hypothetical protein
METQVEVAKTNGHTAVSEAVPGIILRISAQVGHSRSMEVQFACPLDMTPKDLNQYIDKVTAVLNRQNDIGLLAVARANLVHAKKEITTNQEHRAEFESRCRLDWNVSGRRGEFKPTESQRAQLKNWDTNIQNYRENLIPKFEKEIAELERQINEGV